MINNGQNWVKNWKTDNFVSFWSKYGQNLSKFSKRIEKSSHFVSLIQKMSKIVRNWQYWGRKVEKSASFASLKSENRQNLGKE